MVLICCTICESWCFSSSPTKVAQVSLSKLHHHTFISLVLGWADDDTTDLQDSMLTRIILTFSFTMIKINDNSAIVMMLSRWQLEPWWWVRLATLSVAMLSVMVVTILELLDKVPVAVTDRFWSKCEKINRGQTILFCVGEFFSFRNLCAVSGFIDPSTSGLTANSKLFFSVCWTMTLL